MILSVISASTSALGAVSPSLGPNEQAANQSTNIVSHDATLGVRSPLVQWVKESIDIVSHDATWYGWATSIAIDSSGHAHISYVDQSTGALMYATNTDGSWVNTTLDNTYASGAYSDIAVDSHGKVHIAYSCDNPDLHNQFHNSVKYATNAGGSWVRSQIMHTPNDTSQDISIALDSHDNAYVSFTLTNSSFWVVWGCTNSGGGIHFEDGWWNVNYEDPYTWGVGTSIALDSHDNVHISYGGILGGGLNYASFPGDSWSVDHTTLATGHIEATSIAIDSSDKVHIAYSDAEVVNSAANVMLKYATNAGGSWSTETVESGGTYRASPSLALAIDSNNKAHISYGLSADLSYATNAGGSWTSTVVDTFGSAWPSTSIGIGSSGGVHISYVKDRLLMYAVGTILYMTDWNPFDDAYQFVNAPERWGGMCYGMASTALLYYLHKHVDNKQFPEFPNQTKRPTCTLDLEPGSFLVDGGLNNATLAIVLHHIFGKAGQQWYDYQNLAFKDLLTYIKNGHPVLMGISGPNPDPHPVGKDDEIVHAVVAFGITEYPNGSYRINISDPNFDINTMYAWYYSESDPTHNPYELYYQSGEDEYTTLWGLEVYPSQLDVNWFDGIKGWVSPAGHVFMNYTKGYHFAISSKPIQVFEKYANGLSLPDYFDEPSNSTSFHQQIPQSSGIEELDMQAYAIRGANSHLIVKDPALGNSMLFDFWVTNDSDNNTGYGFMLNITSAGTHDCDITDASNGFDLNVGHEPITVNLTLLSWNEASYNQLNATELIFNAGEVANLTIADWTELNSTTGSVVTVVVTPPGGSPTSYHLKNNQVGLNESNIIAPSAPLNLAAVSGNSKVTLSWSAPSSDGGAAIEYYVIFEDGAALPDRPTGLGCVITGLINGRNYSFTVAAHNLAGIGAQSSAVSSIPYTVSDAPFLSLVTSGSSFVTLVWTAPMNNGGSPIIGYKVFYGLTNPINQFDGRLNASTNSVNVTGLTAGKFYNFTVVAENIAGDSPISNIVEAYTSQPPDSDYVFTTSGSPFVATITGYKGAGGAIAIPSTLGGNPTTVIGMDAFANCLSLTSVTIPNGVTGIGAHAFLQCTALTSVTIPNSVTKIESNAFSFCSSLTSVTIPGSVANISKLAFGGCGSLTSVTILDGVKDIGDNAFGACTSLSSLTIPGSVTTIEWQAFAGCTSLTSVTIPDGVTEIGKDAFHGCTSLTSVTIGRNVAYIAEGTFSQCTSLTSITFLGLKAPTHVGGGWIEETPSGLRGHAYTASSFPTPYNDFHNLKMGSSIDGNPLSDLIIPISVALVLVVLLLVVVLLSKRRKKK
jgi:hypothetical protein